MHEAKVGAEQYENIRGLLNRQTELFRSTGVLLKSFYYCFIYCCVESKGLWLNDWQVQMHAQKQKNVINGRALS